MKLELGCGAKPTESYVHHDRFKHSPHVDVAFDLNVRPWPLADNSVEEIIAIDVLEHVYFPELPPTQQVQAWLDELWRVLVPSGEVTFRLPAYDNHYSWRDVTHWRTFHPESFYYFCPNLELVGRSSVWRNFGRYYWGDSYRHWWEHVRVDRHAGDIIYVLRKRIYTDDELRKAAACAT